MKIAHQNDLVAALTALLAFQAGRGGNGQLLPGLVDHAAELLLDVVSEQFAIDREAARKVFTQQVNGTLLPLLSQAERPEGLVQ